MALNDTRLRTPKPKPGKTDRLVADGKGLYIRIRQGEGKITRIWQFRRREAGTLTVTTLGTYPDLPILEARQQALELATKRKTYSPTVETAVEQWLAERIDPTQRKAELVRGYVDRAVMPTVGNRRVRDKPMSANDWLVIPDEALGTRELSPGHLTNDKDTLRAALAVQKNYGGNPKLSGIEQHTSDVRSAIMGHACRCELHLGPSDGDISNRRNRPVELG
jgi:hypothetical protein